MCIHVKYSSGKISITCTFAAHSFVPNLSFIKKTAHYDFFCTAGCPDFISLHLPEVLSQKHFETCSDCLGSRYFALSIVHSLVQLAFGGSHKGGSGGSADDVGGSTSHISNAGNDAENQQRDDHSRNDVGVDGTHSSDIGVVALEHEAHDEAEAHSQSRFCLSTHSLSHDVPPIWYKPTLYVCLFGCRGVYYIQTLLSSEL